VFDSKRDSRIKGISKSALTISNNASHLIPVNKTQRMKINEKGLNKNLTAFLVPDTIGFGSARVSKLITETEFGGSISGVIPV